MSNFQKFGALEGMDTIIAAILQHLDEVEGVSKGMFVKLYGHFSLLASFLMLIGHRLNGVDHPYAPTEAKSMLVDSLSANF